MHIMSHDSNHSVGNGPFVYKQTYKDITTQLFNAVVHLLLLVNV